MGPLAAYEVEEAPPLPPEPAMPESQLPPDQPGLHPSAFGLRCVGPGAAASMSIESGLRVRLPASPALLRMKPWLLLAYPPGRRLLEAVTDGSPAWMAWRH